MASLFAEGDVNINACHRKFCNLVKLFKAPVCNFLFPVSSLHAEKNKMQHGKINSIHIEDLLRLVI